MKAVIEGLLFISGDEGLTLEQLQDILEVDNNEIKLLIQDLFNEYNTNNHGIQIEFLGNHFKFTTKKEHKKYYEKLINNETNSTLSESALEVLSIIAYNEPISRVDVDNIRGVNSAYIVRKLLLNNLIEEKGKSEAPGRPKLYGVTPTFLDYFGLGSTKDLPELQPIEIEKNNSNNLFDTKYTEKN